MNIAKRTLLILLALPLLFCVTSGCHKDDNRPKDSLTLDWKPEPEFGGFYEAKRTGAYSKHGLDVQVTSAGAGALTWQLVANGQTEFATTAADQVLIARSQGVDVVAVFAVYQTFPQGVMTHKARGFTKLEDVFTHEGTLATDADAAWLKYLLAKYAPGGTPKVKLVVYGSGVGIFLAKPDYSQQCFVTSEPLVAAAQGGDPQTFLIADAGYNPYTTVVICKGDLVRSNPAKVKAMALACRQGWRGYLDNPGPANAEMEKLNKDMEPKIFDAGAKAQAPLIETDETRKAGLGVMTAGRWSALAQQLVDLKVIPKAPPAEECFVDVDKLPR